MGKLSDTALWSLCQKYGGLALVYRRKFVALLPEVEKRKLWRRHGFYSIYEFAARVGGVSIKVVDEVLRLDKKLDDKPLLKAQISEVGWTKVDTIASITTKENEAEMVKIVKTLPREALRAYASQIKAVDMSKKEVMVPAGCKLQSVTFKLDQETQFLLHKYQQKLEREKGEPVPLGQVLKVLLKKVQEPVREPRQPKKETKTVSAYKRYEADNGGKCAFPSCNKPHEEIHHPNRQALDPSHSNVVALCCNHHVIAHTGLIENEQKPPNEWKLRDKMELNSVDKKYQTYMQKSMFG